MHLIEIPYCKFVQEIPQEVSELSPEQFQAFMKYFMEFQEGKITYEHWRVKMIMKLLNITRSIKILSPEEFDFIKTELFRLSEIMDSFTTVENEQRAFTLDFTNNLTPYFKSHIETFYGPADALQNISFQEYIDAHNYYVEFLESMDVIALDHLIAVLYRPEVENYELVRKSPDFNGQRRVRYNDNTVSDRALKIGRIPFYTKFGIFMWFSSCEDYLRNGSITLGGVEIKFSTLFKSSSDDESSEDNTGLVGVLFALAESHVFGNVEETARTNLYDVFVRLYQLMMTYKKQKEQHNDKGQVI